MGSSDSLTVKGAMSRQSYFLLSKLNYFKNLKVEVLDHKNQ